MSGPFERDGAETAAEVTAAGSSGVFPSVADSGSGQNGSGDLRARLAGLVRQPFEGWVSSPTEAYANAVADAVLADGFRRVVDDDATVRVVAEALAGVDGWEIRCPPTHEETVRAADVEQADLIAMKHGYHMQRHPSEVNEWVFCEFTATDLEGGVGS